MNIIKKIISKILRATAKALTVVIDGLIHLVETMVLYIGGFFKGCLVLASMGGCLFFLLFVNLSIRILMKPVPLSIIFFLLTFLLFGGKIVSYLKYVKYITVEYLNNTANYLLDKKQYQYKAFSEYKSAFKKAEEERIREEQNRYYEQQRAWEEQFRKNWYQQNYQGSQGSYSGYGGQGSYDNGYVNPTSEFKYQYEKSCDTLGVSYDADKDEIKKAYRKKAKEYHPDLSKLPDATKIFQEINSAYEFLNDDNRQRYKSM
jgi:DnaJ-domain-containing protein 1